MTNFSALNIKNSKHNLSDLHSVAINYVTIYLSCQGSRTKQLNPIVS